MKDNFIVTKDPEINVPMIVEGINKKKQTFNTEEIEEEELNISYTYNSSQISDLSPDIIHRLHLPTSTRGGSVSKINNVFIKKIYYVMRNTLDNLFGHQQHINHVVVKKLRELDSRVPARQDIDFDYLGFENIHRGSLDDITAKQSQYLEYFKEGSIVVDVGCGRGEFLDALKTKNITAMGVDTNSQMVDFCTERGHMVFEEDMMEYLADLRYKIDGIFCAQVIEHLPYNKIIDFVKLAYRRMNKDGVLIMETLNVQVLIPHLGAYYTDPTHENFIHPETMKFICMSAGFKDIEIVYSNPVNDDEKLHTDDSMSEAEKQNVIKLNNLIFGPRDFAIVAKK